MRTLVVGCDASGKSMTLERLHQTYGDPVIESTSTDESRKFKLDNLNTLIDVDFIARREQLYLELTRQTLHRLALEDTRTFIGTDAALVTRLSHSVMRECIGGEEVDHDAVVEQWVEDEQGNGVELPGAIILTHAPFPIISSRIVSRQKEGMKEERFWGFNSQFFLERYQENWKRMMPHLARAGFECIAFDTSATKWQEFLDAYDSIRNPQARPDKSTA